MLCQILTYVQLHSKYRLLTPGLTCRRVKKKVVKDKKKNPNVAHAHNSASLGPLTADPVLHTQRAQPEHARASTRALLGPWAGDKGRPGGPGAD